MIHTILGIEREVFEAGRDVSFVIWLDGADRVRRGGAELPTRGLAITYLYECSPDYRTCGCNGWTTIRCHSTRRNSAADAIAIPPTTHPALRPLARVT